MRLSCSGLLVFTLLAGAAGAADNDPPAGFRALFNGKDLSGWYGMSTEDPRRHYDCAMRTPKSRAERVTNSLAADIQKHWTVQNGELVNDGNGLYLTSDENFGDYELFVSYKTVPKADSGIYLKATPQVQIWDWTEEAKFNIGADKGSGGLWNNTAGKAGKDPFVRADRPFGEWNRFRIRQLGARTTVFLNGKLVVDNAILENYFDRKQPLVAKGPIQLQTHGGEIRWKNIFVREIPAAEANSLLVHEGYVPLFDGSTLNGWKGAVENYEVVDGAIPAARRAKAECCTLKTNTVTSASVWNSCFPPEETMAWPSVIPVRATRPTLGCANCRYSTTPPTNTSHSIPDRLTDRPTE